MHKSFTHAKCHAKSNREADNALEGHTGVLLYSFFRQHLPFYHVFFFLFCLLKLTHRLPSKLILFYLHIYIITYMYVLSVYIWQYCYSSFHSLEHSNDVMYVCIEPMETKSDKRLDCLLFFNRILRHMHLRLVHTCHTSLSLKNFHNKKKTTTFDN